MSCNGGNDGSIDLTPSGGTGPYTFNWSNAETTEDITGLTAGTYNVTITDANSCTATTSAAVNEPSVINLTTVITDVSCNSGSDGAIEQTNPHRETLLGDSVGRPVAGFLG